MYESATPPALSHSPSLTKVKADCQDLPGAKQNLFISAWIVWLFLLFKHLSPFCTENSVFWKSQNVPVWKWQGKSSLFFIFYFYFLAKIISKSWPRRFYPPWICVIPWTCYKQRKPLPAKEHVFREPPPNIPLIAALLPSGCFYVFTLLMKPHLALSSLYPSSTPDSPLLGTCSAVTISLTKNGGLIYYFANCHDCCFLSASPEWTPPLKFGLLHWPSAATSSPSSLLPRTLSAWRVLQLAFLSHGCIFLWAEWASSSAPRAEVHLQHRQHRTQDHFRTHLWAGVIFQCERKRTALSLLMLLFFSSIWLCTNNMLFHSSQYLFIPPLPITFF